MEMLQFITAGNVDDGKSTLIGRLLYDSNAILEDQLHDLREASEKRGSQRLDLALLTDGLRAEREQGITIDVAYRYFNTARRKFIIADCPGHVQYTRNMVTGASRASLAVILVDARKGIVEQTRRHCFVAATLQIPHLVICVNKMDLVDYQQPIFEAVRADFGGFAKKLDIHDVVLIPVCAQDGDNVVTASTKMPWYHGRTLLDHLEEVYISSDCNLVDMRFPIQRVLRGQHGPMADYRGYAGMVASGTVRQGDEVVALPSGFRTSVKAVEQNGASVGEASCGMSVVVRLADELDVGRGDMLVRPNNQPQADQDVSVILCWLHQAPLELGKRYLVRHTTAEVQGLVDEISYKFDINTLSRQTEFSAVGLNDFAKVKLRVSKPLLYDSYRFNRHTGSLILVDPSTGATCAAGMILSAAGKP